ncbi:MAG: helix-turn-helix domain-containing protein [Pseudomonadota bacterium]
MMQLDLERWRDLASPMFEVYRHDQSKNARVDIEVENAGGLFISKVVTPHERVVHDPKIQKSVRHDYLLFGRIFSGSGRSEVDGVGFDVRPSKLQLVDYSKRLVSEKTRCQSRGVCIPHELIGFDPSKHPSFVTLDLDSPQGRLLASAQDELWAAKQNGSAADEELLAAVFVDLVRKLMLGQSGKNDHELAAQLPMRVLLKDHIAVNLHRPDLGAETLAMTFNVSRPTIYRHFEESRGVARYVRNARLERCFFELSIPSGERGRVAAVARRWHFHDAANFSRLFRERFGISPSEVSNGRRALAHACLSEKARFVRDWFNTRSS